MLIDYEYGGWNPMAMDLAKYINETMLDNSYPFKNGVSWYLDNCMSVIEIENMVKTYMKCYYEKYLHPDIKDKYKSEVTFIDSHLAEFMKQVFICC